MNGLGEGVKISKKFLQIAKKLKTEELQRFDESEVDLSDLDLFSLDIGKRGPHRFLGFYSREGIILGLKKYGFYKALRRRGYRDVRTIVDTDDPYRHRLAVETNDDSDPTVLIEFVVKKEFVKIGLPFEHPLDGVNFQALAIEWLTLQHPLGKFSEERPRLPGQKYPGLGMARMILELLLIMSWRLKLSGLVNTPAHYHTAYLFSRAFHYLDPAKEAKLMALSRDLREWRLANASWAVEWGCIRHRMSGEPMEWIKGQQLCTLNHDLQRLFACEAYCETSQRLAQEMAFEVDREAFRLCSEQAGPAYDREGCGKPMEDRDLDTAPSGGLHG